MPRVLPVSIVLNSCLSLFFVSGLAAQRSDSPRGSAADSSCPDWSAKFDAVDDASIVKILRAHREQGWDAIIQQGEKLGVSLLEQIADGETQLDISRQAETRARTGIASRPRSSSEERQAPDCSDPDLRETDFTCQVHVIHNEVLALEGVLDLLRCRAPAHPGPPARPAGTPIATFSVTVAPSTTRFAWSRGICALAK